MFIALSLLSTIFVMNQLVLINIFALLVWCFLSNLLILTLEMGELCHWPSIVGMLPHSHCGDEEDRSIGLSS